MRGTVGLVAALVVLVIAGCAGLRDVQPPHVRLADIRMVPGGVLEQQFDVVLNIGNPNDFDLPLDGLTFELEVNEQPFAQGFTNQSVTVPRLGEARVPVRASTSLFDMIQQMLVLGKRADLTYRIEGVAYLEGLARRAVPYERSGRLQLLPDQGQGQTLVPL